jgi:hypothetical protein
MKTIDILKSKLAKLLDLSKVSPSPSIPATACVLSTSRSGLSALKTTFAILARKKELGLPVGEYEDGSMNQNDLLINAIVTEIFKAIQEDAKITVGIEPGQTIQGTGANAGGPIAVVGTTLSFGSGGAVMQ